MKQFLFFTLLLTNITLFGQNGSVEGTVKDINGEAIYGADVLVRSKELIGTTTDENGQFKLSLSPGNYLLVCRAEGMISDSIEIKIVAGSLVEHRFELKDINSTVIDDVEIKVGKFDKPLENQTVSIEVLKPRMIESKNTRSIETALDQTPGLNILDGEPQIRGGSGFTFGVGSKVAVLVDDMPMLSGDAGRPEWGFIPVENISQVEIIKGAASVLSGSSALSGSVNIRTAYPTDKPLTKVILYGGMYSKPSEGERWYNGTPAIAGVNFLHSRKQKQWDLVVGGNFNYDHGYIGPPKTDSLVWEDTITNFNNKQMSSKRARVNFQISRRSKNIKGLLYGINGNGMLAQSAMIFAWLNDTSGLYNAYPGAVFLQDQLIFNLDPFVVYSAKKGSKHSLRTRILRTVNEMTANQNNQSTVLYGDYQYKKSLKRILPVDLIFGITAQNTHSYSNIYVGSGDPTNTLLNLSSYAQIEKKLLKKLNVSAGGRLEYFQLNENTTAFKPIFRAGANYQLHTATFVRGSFGQGYRFPTITERFIKTGVGNLGVFPNPELKPETSWNAEIGIKQGFKLGPVMSFFDVAGFWQEYQNTIEYMFGVWNPITSPEALASSAGFMFLNTGNSRVQGIDVSIAGQVKAGHKGDVTFLAGYNYILPTTLSPDYLYATDSLNRAFTYNTTSLDPSRKILKYRFLHNVKADFEYMYNKRFALGFSAKFISNHTVLEIGFGMHVFLTS
jgi:outer membrane receptor protein involved in Fe transport